MDGQEAIAIVGIGCKFPGADNIEEFWKVLEQGEDHVQNIPKERFNVEAFYDANPDVPGKLYMKKAGLVKGFSEWDNHFFGFGENEARQIDPQQRFVLDCVHMAMEDGGITRQDVYGTDTGVYIGIMNDDYKLAFMGQDELINNYTVTGTNTGVTSARVSYHYNLLGPSMVIDTACSSALVAIHLAASAMRSGEISMAICGGVSCMINPENFISLSKAKMASPTGKCQTFSKHADGYARGEGCGIVILKKLYKAQEDNNKVWGIIATGCNQDGRTTSPITAPSSSQQTKLLEKVFKENDVCPSTIQYIEAHGTGTSVGDPIEANALGSFFLKYQTSKEKEFLIGSVKTNIGHLESAAGVAGLIKILLMMNRGIIVPSLHSKELNPKIDFQKYNFAVPQVTTKWFPTTTGERIACLNSFGFGGTNSHAIVKGTIHSSSPQTKANNGTLQIIVLSANDAISLRKTAERYIQNVKTSKFSIESLAYTSTVRRDHFRLRSFVIADSKTSLQNLFHLNFNDVKMIRPVPLQTQSVIFVFCGVGTAWRGMCKELLQKFSVFRDVVREIDSVLLPLTKWSIFDILSKGESVTEYPIINHIAIFTCQIALVHLWRSFGITPMSVIGQSVGEVAAAYTSGALDLEQAITVIYHRSRVLAETSGGGMAVVQGANLEEIELKCKTLESGNACIAVYISNDCCTVSGDTKALEELKHSLKSKQDIRWVDLNVPCAYHSHLTKEPGLKLAKEIKHLKPNTNTIPVFSSVTGGQITQTQYCNPSYWAANVTEKVKFFQAVTASGKLNNSIYLEIGPSPVLRPHVTKIFPNDIVEVVPSMTMKADIRQFLWAVGKLYVLGLNLDWKNLFERTPQLADIPTYCFNCKSLFEESVVRAVKRTANIDSSKQNLLIEKGSNDKCSVILNEQRTPYIFEHKVEESIIVPGALYGAIGMELGKAVLGLHGDIEVGWEIENPLAINENHSTELTVESDKTGNSLTYRIFDVKRRMLSRGSVSKSVSLSRPDQYDIRIHKDRLDRKPCDDFIYNTLQRFGINHGPLYKTVRKGIYTKRECFVEVKLSESHFAMFDGADLHPIVIDSILQCCCAFLPFFDIPLDSKLFPVGVGNLCTKQKVTAKMYIYAKNVKKDSHVFYSNAILLQENGIVVAEMLNIETRIMNMPLNGFELSLRYNWHTMMVEEEEKSNIVQQLIVLSRRRQTLDFIRDETIYDIVYLDDSLEFDVAKEAILSRNPDLLAYVPGHLKEQIDIQEIYDEILNDGKTFLKLVKSFSHLELKVVTVTEATQNLNTESQTVNLLGSELWGMVRSVAREPTKLSFYLIDTYPDLQQNLKALNTMLYRISEDDEDIPFESCIVNGEIHYGSVQQTFTNDTSRLSVEDIPERKGIPVHQNRTHALENRSETLLEVSVVVACRSMFDTSDGENITSPPKIGQIWGKENGNEVETKCLEFIGSPLDRQKKNQNLICCYPCSLQPRISVPKHFTCPKDDIPNYSLGMFQSCIWAMTISENLRNIKTVIAMTDEDFHWAFWILGQILNKKDIAMHFVSDVDDFDPKKSDKTCLLILQSAKQLKLDEIAVDCFTTVVYFNSKYETLFEDKGIFKKIFIQSNEIFSLQNISKKMKEAKRLLKKITHKNIPKKVTDNTYGEFFMENENPKGDSNHGSTIVKENSSYIVVGGLTGLGWLIVKQLVRCSAKKVIIFSRRIPEEKMQRKIKGINDISDGQIIPIQVDICNSQSLSRVFQDLKSLCQNEPIRGIFHGAAVTADKFASEMSLDQYEVPLKPKVLGTLNLDKVSRDLELDYFVTHSSIAALFGNVGQCNYAAGNAFQDCFALYRRSCGMPATSIIWSALDIGLAADTFTKESLRSSGLISLSPQQILDCTNIALRSGDVYQIFAHIDWKVFLQTFIGSQKSKFKDFWSDSPLALSATLAKSGNVEPVDENGLIEMVLDCVANVFALHPSQISATTPIVEFGLDSQKGTELASLIFDRSFIRVPYIFIATDDHSAFDIAQFVKSRQDMGILNELSNGNKIQKKTLCCFLEDVLLTKPNVVYNEVYLVVKDATTDEFTIQTSLQVLLYSYPELRTMLKIEIDSTGKDILRKEIREIEDAVSQIEICDCESPDDAMTVRGVDCEAFKINILRRSKDIVVILMFCPLMFDAYCIVRITEEVSKLINNSRAIPSIYSTMSEYQNESQQPKFEEFLALEEDRIKIFWKAELSRQKDSILTESKKGNTAHRWTTINIPDHVVSLLHNMGCENDMSIYQTMCCFAQIALGIVTKASEVTILAQTDMRSLIGLDEIEVGMYSNLIPLITDFSEQRNSSLQDFILSTVRKFKSMEEEGKFPFHLIQDLPEYEESKHQNLVCFFIDENNLNEYRKTVQVQGYRPGFTTLASVELMIVSSSKHIKLYVSSEESMHATGVAILHYIYHLSELYIGNGDIKLKEVLSPNTQIGDFGNTNGILFMKKKRTPSSAVEPKISTSKGNSKCLQLGNINLPLSDIVSVSVSGEDRQRLVIETKKKNFKLYANDVSTCEVWSTFINCKMDRQMKGWKWRGSQSCLVQPISDDVENGESTYL